MSHRLQKLTPNMAIVYGGSRVTLVSEELAQRFQPGDELLIVAETGDLLHVPAVQKQIATEAVSKACAAFQAMREVSDAQISHFYQTFADLLLNDAVWETIAKANAADVQSAKSRDRSTTRLMVTEKMRQEMIDGLLAWRDAPTRRGQIVERVVHDGWAVEQVADALGVIGFVFEGRPNVFADATGVLRGGNTVVFRIGGDALATAQALDESALRPALQISGLPHGAVTLVESADHASGWAMFSDGRLSLAVARGSGKAVEQLGSVARHAGTPVSLHGTGGAWLVADAATDREKFSQAVINSLDRKVCNTLNVCCIPENRVNELIPAFLDSLIEAGKRRGQGVKLHIIAGSEAHLPKENLDKALEIDILPIETLAREWEWEETPELTLVIVTGMAEAARLFNEYSPQFVASLITENIDNFNRFYELVNSPFVGNGFTRWVDGQYALGRPELGLSNWQSGRGFARGGILSGDGIYTIRARMTQSDPDQHR